MLHAGLDLSRKRIDFHALGADGGGGRACKSPVYRGCYQRTKQRLGKQRGAKVALARRLAEAIWHMLSRNQSFAPRGAANALAA